MPKITTSNGFTPVGPEDQGVFYSGPEGSFEIENVGEFAAGPSLKETDDQNRQAKRSGFLSRQDKIKIAKRLVVEIEADLARLRKQAKTNTASFIQKRIFAAEQQIAAWRIVAGGFDLPFFYMTALTNGSPIYRQNNPQSSRTYYVTSGDGKQTAQASLPLKASDSVFGYAQSDRPALSDDDIDEIAVVDLRINTSDVPPPGAGDPPVMRFDITTSQTIREMDDTDFVRQWRFPLGNGECLVVINEVSFFISALTKFEYTYQMVEERETTEDPANVPVCGVPFVQNNTTFYPQCPEPTRTHTFSGVSFSTEIEVPLTKTSHYIAFRVGYEKAEAVPVPSGLLSALQAIEVPDPTGQSTPEWQTPSIIPAFIPSGPAGDDCRANACITTCRLDGKQYDFVSGYPCDQIVPDSDWAFTYGDPYPTASFDQFGNLNFPSGEHSYGIGVETPTGGVANANPIYWYSLDSFDKYFEVYNAETVGNLLSISASDYGTIGDLNKKFIIGVPENFSLSPPIVENGSPGVYEGKEQIYKWKKDPVLVNEETGFPYSVGSGPPFEPYETEEGILRSDTWGKLSKTKRTDFQFGQHSEFVDYWNNFPNSSFAYKMARIPIFDWRQSSFCKARAAQYGISLES